MSISSPFAPRFGDLPPELPIFPLSGVTLLPRGRLPLNIFEPRYLAMVDDALQGNRLIGMIQLQVPAPAVFSVGCAGRIVSFDETDDGRYQITLAGICRFRIVRELDMRRGYRRVEPDWAEFQSDLASETCHRFDRARFTQILQAYFRRQGLSADWTAIESTPDERLLTSLAMICPFAPQEKQALLEAPTLSERAQIMLTLLEMAIANGSDPQQVKH
jgi:Lon protease-like protein